MGRYELNSFTKKKTLVLLHTNSGYPRALKIEKKKKKKKIMHRILAFQRGQFHQFLDLYSKVNIYKYCTGSNSQISYKNVQFQ